MSPMVQKLCSELQDSAHLTGNQLESGETDPYFLFQSSQASQVLQNRKFRRLTRLVLDSGGAQVGLICDSEDSCDPDMFSG